MATQKRLTPIIIRRTALYYVIFATLGMSSAALGPTIPGLAAQTAVGLSAISILFTARAIGRLFGTYVAGHIYDRVPGHPVIAAALVMMGIMTLTTSFLPVLALIIGVFLILGFGEGLLDVGMNTMLIWTHDDFAGPFINGMHFFFGVGAFVFPLLIAPIVLYTGTPDTTFIEPFFAAGIPQPPLEVDWVYRILALVFLPMPLLLLRMRSPANSKVDTQNPTTSTQPINWRLVLPFAMFFMLYVGAESSYSGWVYTYAVELGLADAGTASYLVSAFWLTVTIGRLAAIPLSARFAPRVILRTAVMGSIASVGLIIAIPDSITLWIGTITLGLSMAAIFPTTLAFAGRNIALNGRITSYFYVGAGIGVSSVPWLIGQVFERIGPATMPLIVLGVLVIQLGVYFLLIYLVEGRQPSKR